MINVRHIVENITEENNMSEEVAIAEVKQVDDRPEFVLKWMDSELKELRIRRGDSQVLLKSDDKAKSIRGIIEAGDADNGVISALQERMHKQTGSLFDYDDLFNALLHLDYTSEKEIVFEDFPDMAKEMIRDTILKASERWECKPTVGQHDQLRKFIEYVTNLRRFFSFEKNDAASKVGMIYVNGARLEYEWLAFNQDAEALSKKYNVKPTNCGVRDYIRRVTRYVQISDQISRKSAI